MLGQSKGAVKGLKAAGKLAKVPGLHPIIIYNSQLLKAYRKALQGANKFKNSEACKALQLREVEIDLEPYTEDSDVRLEFFRNLYKARGCDN
jgi:hypothetical protein